VSSSSFPFAEIFRAIEGLLKTSPGTEAGMRQLVDECERVRPHPDWDCLRVLPYGSSARQVATWLSGTLTRTPPPAKVDGPWFGLFNPVYEDETAADLYVCGNPYSPSNGDWACAPHLWKPKTAYCWSELLRDIYRTAYCRPDRKGLGSDAEYPVCLGFAALAVCDALRGLDVGSRAHECAVFVGFDDGDFVEISRPRGRALA
jgi:hypothetical protein